MSQRASGTLETLVQTHLDALHTSSRLSSHFRKNFQPMASDVTPEHVIQVLHEAGIKCILMGAHALNTYRDEPRATQDVDILVRKKDLSKALRVLSMAFNGLILQDTPEVTRFVDPATNKVVLDLMKPSPGVFQVIFRHTLAVGDTHLIPDLEMALAAKFAAMVSPNRRPDKKMLDAADFANVVMGHRSAISVKKLQRLAAKVYPDGDKEILQVIQDIDAGRTIRI
jgi:hypothetical protein